MSEAPFYNALQIALQSDYRKLKLMREKSGDWEKVWKTLDPRERGACDPRKEWGRLEKSGVRLILKEENEYPRELREIAWAPFGIYVRGNLRCDDSVRIAIVGTRKGTREGEECAKKFGRELASSGIPIISGLAFGIDAAAHRGALEAQGYTLAVLSSGLDRIYPQSHENLAKKILEAEGALISEYPLGSPPLPYRFVERNRIISGFSRGVLIIEAPSGSGSLITARFALEQNREVFVLPGPVGHPNFFGSHELIRSGAELVTSPLHILGAFGLGKSEGREGSNLPATREEELVLELLRRHREPLTIDKIIELSNLKANIVSQTVSFLLIKNVIRETDQGYCL